MRTLRELAECIARLSERTEHPAWVPGMTVFATPRVTHPLGDVTRPVLALIAQGAKRTVLADRVYDYQAGQYLIATVDLPVTAQITRASGSEPFLGLGLPLRETLIAQLLLETGAPRSADGPGTGIVTGDAEEELLDAVVRLLRLVERPQDFAVLAPGVEREIHWRLMTGPHGATIRRIGVADSRVSLVGQAVRWIGQRYDRTIRIADLAEAVGVSVPTLNRHFRAVTAMSPVQYQKHLRLQRARIQLLAAPEDIAAVGHAVGYDSPSQFSREYRRLFGAPPGRDALRLHAAPGN
ncbi:AraC family transcriptional regulator [Kutzneria viridogrisea]|uniref:AraC-like DNA-binding protein n=1 Tax=Kutzneria viridogrisea TaxID=47990 RepID=A0ABR6BJ19_9PSEU|nr:AraC-like DNA-binding protein [Kutzneria viridogrisea]